MLQSASLRQRLERSAVSFQLAVQLAADGDKIDDPSVAWPESRDTVVLGTLGITHVAADAEAAERGLIFSPAAVTAGIQVADPMIQARDDAYGVSYDRRHGCPVHH